MNMYFKKRIAALFILLITVTSIMAVPQRTHAYWGILDTSFDLGTFGQIITNAAKDAAQWAKENYQKVMRDVIAKRLIDYTVDETVKWVQGGGDPKFVTDWKGFMEDAGNMAFDSVIKEAGLSDICQPFALQLQVALIPEKRFKKERVECSISDIVANVESFYESFENGGWLAYGESIKPENNLYMQLVMFDDELKVKTTFNQDQKTQKAATGQGFLSVSKCTADNSQELYDQCVADSTAEGQDPGATDCYTYADTAKECTKEEVQTPGSMVGKAVGESITSDKEWSANIQSWTSALVNAAINRLTKEGIALMTGSSATAAPDSDPAATEYGDVKESENAEYQKERIDRIEKITKPYGKYVAEEEKAKGFTQQILDLFDQIKLLDTNNICVPQTAASEITDQQTLLNGFNSEIGKYKPAVTEGTALIVELKTLTSSVRDTTLANQKTTAFEGKHPGTEQGAVEQQLQTVAATPPSATQNATLQTIQSRYNQCKQKIDLLNTTP